MSSFSVERNIRDLSSQPQIILLDENTQVSFIQSMHSLYGLVTYMTWYFERFSWKRFIFQCREFKGVKTSKNIRVFIDALR